MYHIQLRDRAVPKHWQRSFLNGAADPTAAILLVDCRPGLWSGVKRSQCVLLSATLQNQYSTGGAMCTVPDVYSQFNCSRSREHRLEEIQRHLKF
ncbi:hypothetical protein PBY51_014662 [Eleginops maclovinus]|uniref:Uncharacterized protein n=1 Tax=Eleginops maclovinus TaxID=56733 RepID=A0AAN7WWS5_ELEMC|nr:hypothetical protein PBY51_014662 [Eleginops maclovinus]